MEQENMKETFTNPSVGVNINSPVDEINEKLDKITSILSDIYKSVSNTKTEEVTPVIEKENKVEETPVIGIPELETNNIEIPESIEEIKTEEIPALEETPVIPQAEETPVLPEVVAEESKLPEIEETKVEEPFTPVSIDEIKTEEPVPSVIDEVNSIPSITPIDEILASETPKVEEPKIEEIKPDVIAPETVLQTEEQPSVQPVDPVITPDAIKTDPIIEPVAPVSNPVIELTKTETEELATQPKVEETISNKKEYKDVTILYVGMTDVKTGNDPHRVIPVTGNDFAKKESKVNSLVMNKIA